MEALRTCVVGEGIHRVHTPAFTLMSKIGLLVTVYEDVRYKLRGILFINHFKIVPITALLLSQRVFTSGMIEDSVFENGIVGCFCYVMVNSEILFSVLFPTGLLTVIIQPAVYC